VVRDVVYETRRGISVPPGDYPISITAGLADNYVLSFADGVLTVKPVALIRSENLIVQQATQVVAPAMTQVPSPTAPLNAQVSSNLPPGVLTVRDSGMLGGGATLPASTAPAAGAFQVVVVNRPAGSTESLFVKVPSLQTRVTAGSPFNVDVPRDAFASTRSDARVTLTATLADGKPLPAWMKFDAQTGRVVGKAPPGFRGDLAVRVIARDERGNQATQLLTIAVGR
jgi:hypothetical protein